MMLLSSSRLILAIAIVQLLLLSNRAVADDWELLWSDEFDTPTTDAADERAQTQEQPNKSKWNMREGYLGFNGEFQTYTKSADNVKIQDGKLHLTAIRDSTAQVGYTSGRVNTQDKLLIKYATVEASIKIPSMKMGLWPAFWTLGQNYDQVGWPAAGEVDIMEIGQKQGASMGKINQRVLSAVHWDAVSNYAQEAGYLDMPMDLSQDFHTYKMEWQPEYIATYVDDNLIHRFRIADCATLWDCPELHQHHFLVMNLAVAGQFTCCEYGFELNAYPEGTGWTMEVDYVRVYGNEHTELIITNATSATGTEGGYFVPSFVANHTDDQTVSPVAYNTDQTLSPTVSPTTGTEPVAPTVPLAEVPTPGLGQTEAPASVVVADSAATVAATTQTTESPMVVPQTETLAPTEGPISLNTLAPVSSSMPTPQLRSLTPTTTVAAIEDLTVLPVTGQPTNSPSTILKEELQEVFTSVPSSQSSDSILSAAPSSLAPSPAATITTANETQQPTAGMFSTESDSDTSSLQGESSSTTTHLSLAMVTTALFSVLVFV